MSDQPEISICMPAYLEEENLRLLLPRLNQVLKSMAIPYEILVLDTQEPLDKTKSACEANSARWIPRRGGNTFGDAMRTAISEAHGKWLLFMDSDGSHTPEFIPQLYQKAPGNDVVIASRYVKGGYTENPTSLIWMSRILNLSYSIILGLKCKDVSNSFKIYRGDLLRKVTTYCKNFDIIEEILFKLSRQNRDLKIVEIPFTFKKRMFGNTKRNLLVFILTYIFTIIKLRLNYRSGTENNKN